MYSVAVRNTGSLKAQSITLQTAAAGRRWSLARSTPRPRPAASAATSPSPAATSPFPGPPLTLQASAGGGYVKSGATSTAGQDRYRLQYHRRRRELDPGRRPDKGTAAKSSSGRITPPIPRRISARGGAASGDGGQAEVSGHGALTYAGTADLTAPFGVTGTLLLDPVDVQVGGISLPGFPDGASDTADVGGLTISTAALLLQLQTGNVNITATNNINVRLSRR